MKVMGRYVMSDARDREGLVWIRRVLSTKVNSILHNILLRNSVDD